MTIVTGPPHLRPAAGWLARRGAELADGTRSRVLHRGAEVPPRRLRARVGAPGAKEFREGGASAAAALAASLTPRGIDTFTSVLDFGCGAGRVLTHIAALAPGARLTGVDVDAAAIAWASAHLGGISFEHSAALPPLPFPDGAFDLIYAISVFSHLDADAQDAWLAEFTRVLVPGGIALLTTHGPSAFAAFRSGAVQTTWCDPGAFARGPLDDAEFVTVPYRDSRWSRGDLPGVGERYGLSFHGCGYIREHWGRFVKIEAIHPQAISGWQDLIVARAPVTGAGL